MIAYVAKIVLFENRNVNVRLSTCVAEAQKTLFAAKGNHKGISYNMAVSE